MKLASKVMGIIGVILLVVGASAMDSELIIIPIAMVSSGLLLSIASALIGGLFWEYEEF